MSRGAVHPFGDERRHFLLAMARAAGADLQAAPDAGRVGHGDRAGVVQRRRGRART